MNEKLQTYTDQMDAIISYLSFKLKEEHFAINVSKVLNILEMQAITKVPKSPEFVLGVINLRGDVLPVIDTNNKLGLEKTIMTNNTCILVIESKINNSQVKFGILVDTVQEVLEIKDKDILPSPSIGDKYETELIIGVVEKQEKFIMILDINKLLDFNDVLNINKLNKNKI